MAHNPIVIREIHGIEISLKAVRDCTITVYDYDATRDSELRGMIMAIDDRFSTYEIAKTREELEQEVDISIVSAYHVYVLGMYPNLNPLEKKVRNNLMMTFHRIK